MQCLFADVGVLGLLQLFEQPAAAHGQRSE